jgi:hypothetical protein
LKKQLVLSFLLPASSALNMSAKIWFILNCREQWNKNILDCLKSLTGIEVLFGPNISSLISAPSVKTEFNTS